MQPSSPLISLVERIVILRLRLSVYYRTITLKLILEIGLFVARSMQLTNISLSAMTISS
jgi:hypothetical protein